MQAPNEITKMQKAVYAVDEKLVGLKETVHKAIETSAKVTGLNFFSARSDVEKRAKLISLKKNLDEMTDHVTAPLLINALGIHTNKVPSQVAKAEAIAAAQAAPASHSPGFRMGGGSSQETYITQKTISQPVAPVVSQGWATQASAKQHAQTTQPAKQDDGFKR